MTRHRRAILPLAAFTALAAISAAEPASARGGRGAQQDDLVLSRPAGPPIMGIVSLSDQRVTIYDAEGPIARAPVSSGQTDYETPVGIYSVLQKEAEHYSNRYDDASMPFMQRITWSGVALHGGVLPGYPASHGCVRLPQEFAERLFGMTKVGMRVLVARKDVAPVAVSHPLLFKPVPFRNDVALLTQTAALSSNPIPFGPPRPPEPTDNRAAALQAIIAAKTAEADAAEKRASAARLIAKQKSGAKAQAMKALRLAETAKKRAEARFSETDRDLGAAKTPKASQEALDAKAEAATKLAEAESKLQAVKADAQPKIDDHARAIDEVKAAQAVKTAALEVAHDAERKLSPVSVFISLKTQKLYVRQAFEPLFESPVTIRDPDQPIGTHIYTAVDYADGARDMRWSVVAIGGRHADELVANDEYDDYDRPRRRHQTRTAEPAPTDVAAATAALDRITIPQDAVERISELVLPGSSLIVSDEEAHKETGKATDFVVLISGEPQGGIKLRPRQMNPYDDEYDDYDRRYRRGPFRGGGFFRWW